MRPLLAALPLVLSACAQEVYLVSAPPRESVTPTGARPSVPTVPVPPRPPSPWGNLDPGSLPDLRFVVAHSDWDCSGWYDGYARDLWGGCPAGYAVVDLRGQVLLEIALEDLLDGPVDPWAMGHLGVAPAGPGKVLISLQYQMFDDAEEDSVTWWEYPNYAILFDAWTGASEVVARWQSWGNRVYLPQTGRFIHLPTRNGPTFVQPWPGTDELAIWQGDWSCGEAPTDLLWHIDPRGGDWALGRWDAAELGLEMPGRPLCFEGAAAGGPLVFARTDDSCAAEPSGAVELTFFTKESGPVQVAAEGWAWWNGSGIGVSMDGQAVLATPTVEDGSQRWVLWTPEGAQEGTMALEGWRIRPGPVLDAAGPTFALLASRADGLGERIHVVHEGQSVWQIDDLVFGLQHRPKYLAGVAPLLPPVAPR